MIYNKLLSDKLEANLGYVYENAVAQMLIAGGNNLFYYTMESEKYVVHTKDYKWENGIHYIPVYMVPFL